MKGKRILMGMLVALSLVLVLLSSRAMASYATSMALLKWDELSITGDITWQYQYTNTSASAYANTPPYWDDQSDSPEGWGDSISTASVPQATSTATATNPELSATSQTGPYGQVEPSSGAYSYRGGSFTYNGSAPGYVDISVPFSVSHHIEASWDGYADVWSYVKIDLSRGYADGEGHYSISEYRIDDGAYEGHSYDAFKDGTLSVILKFYPGETGGFYAEANTSTAVYSAVPIPGAVILLGSGLIGLVGFRRKFNKA